MNTWKHCIADVYYRDGRPALTHDEGYIVRITDESIEVAYDDEEGAVCYRGGHTGDGHYHLTAPERDGRASLHRFPNSHFLEGFWHEGESRGMWRIELK